MLTQWVHAETVDDNVFTVPYTLFFAAWSISFLTSWQRRENEHATQPTNFVSTMMNVVSKRMNFSLQMMDLVLTMMDFANCKL